MTHRLADAAQLAADIARLARLSRAELLRETGAAEKAEARGGESDADRAYRAALEKESARRAGHRRKDAPRNASNRI